MSRFAVDPRLLAYLPPTMSPTGTSHIEGYLEHPAEAFATYKTDGVARVVCEEKHMGSRAVALVCRDADVARERFGVDGPTGVVHTRAGRPFFDDQTIAELIVSRLRTAVTEAGLWDELQTDWLLLDAELMPLVAQGVRTAATPVRRRGRRGACRLSRRPGRARRGGRPRRRGAGTAGEPA